MIIELVGPPGAGKTEIAKALAEKGIIPVRLKKHSLILYALVGALFHPLATYSVLKEVMRAKGMRRYLFINSLLYPLAAQVVGKFRDVTIEHGFVQGFFALPRDVQSVRLIPKSDLIVWVETPEDERRRRLQVRGWSPREEFGAEEGAAVLARAEAIQQSLYEAVKRWGEKRFIEVSGTDSVTESVHTIQAALSPRWRPSLLHQFFKHISYSVSYAIRCVLYLFTQKPEVSILMYHAVDTSGWKLAITPTVFEKQIAYLKKHFEVVPLESIVSYAKGEHACTKKTVAITFDDGYEDIKTTVLPLIQTYDIPITVFIPTDTSLPMNPLHTSRMSWSTIREVAKDSRVSFQSHTQTHPHLTRISREALAQELSASRSALERELGSTPDFLAYPYGDRNRVVEEATRAAGYSAALAITEGLITEGDDVFALKRIQVDHTMSTWLFRVRLTRAIDIHYMLMRALGRVLH